MSRLAELQRDLQSVSAAIVRAERSLAAHPSTPSVAATLRTIHKRRDGLEEQFLAAAKEMGLDVCSYRIEMPDYRQATILGMTSVLGSFQKIFTNVYNGIVNGIKKSSKVGADVIETTSLGFAYTFPGSLGVVMTLENDRLLLAETNLDLAMKKTFELMTYSTSDQIQAAAQEVGLPAVRQTYQWASDNAKAGYGADIVWHREGVTKFEVRIQPQEIVRLESAIRVATAREQIEVTGDLLNVNIPERTFQMAVADQTISGGFDDAISRTNPAQLPKKYKAILSVREKVVTQQGEDPVSYFLVRLEEPEPPPALLEASPSS